MWIPAQTADLLHGTSKLRDVSLLQVNEEYLSWRTYTATNDPLLRRRRRIILQPLPHTYQIHSSKHEWEKVCVVRGSGQEGGQTADMVGGRITVRKPQYVRTSLIPISPSHPPPSKTHRHMPKEPRPPTHWSQQLSQGKPHPQLVVIYQLEHHAGALLTWPCDAWYSLPLVLNAGTSRLPHVSHSWSTIDNWRRHKTGRDKKRTTEQRGFVAWRVFGAQWQ